MASELEEATATVSVGNALIDEEIYGDFSGGDPAQGGLFQSVAPKGLETAEDAFSTLGVPQWILDNSFANATATSGITSGFGGVVSTLGVTTATFGESAYLAKQASHLYGDVTDAPSAREDAEQGFEDTVGFKHNGGPARKVRRTPGKRFKSRRKLVFHSGGDSNTSKVTQTNFYTNMARYSAARRARRARNYRRSRARNKYYKPRGFNRMPVGTYKKRYNAVVAELKYRLFDRAAQVVGTSWVTANPATVASLSAVLQGIQKNARIGSVVKIKSIHIKGNFAVVAAKNITDPSTATTARFALILDSNTGGAQAVTSEVFDEAATVNVLCMRNLSFTSRYKTLYDKSVVIHPAITNVTATTYTEAEATVPFEIYHEFKPPLRVKYNGTGDTYASVQQNGINFLAVSDNSDNKCYVQYHARIRYYDS